MKISEFANHLIGLGIPSSIRIRNTDGVITWELPDATQEQSDLIATEFAVFDFETGRIPPSLSEVKDAAKAQIDVLMGNRVYNTTLPFTATSGTFDIPFKNDTDKANFSAMSAFATDMLASIIPSSNFPVFASTGVFLVTPAEMKQIAIQLLVHVQTQYAWANTKKAAIDSATTKEEVDSIIAAAESE